MKKLMTLVLTSMAVALATSAFPASNTKLASPQHGVLCDTYMCVDASGISKALTEKFLGAATATKLFAQGSFDTTEFTFANGVFCDTKEKLCHQDRYFDASGKRSPIDAETTAKLFGS